MSPGQFITKQHVLESVRYSADGGYLYLNNAKAGCSTIKYLLWARGQELGEVVEAPNSRTVHGLGFWGRTFRTDEPFRFSLVRNPYSRVLSAYLDKIAKPNVIRRRFCAFYGVDPAEEISFVRFLRLLTSQPSPYDDQHWRLQTQNLLVGGLDIDFVGHLEHSGEDLDAIADRLELRLSQSRGRGHAVGATDKLSAYYDDEAYTIVSERYSDDFEVFAYQQSLDQLTPSDRHLAVPADSESLTGFIAGVGREADDTLGAAALWEEARKVDADNGNLVACLVSAYRRLGDHEKLAELVSLAPRPDWHARVDYEVADVKLRDGDLAGSMARLEMAINKDPSAPGFLQRATKNMLLAGDPQRALGFAQAAIRIQPNHLELLTQAGRAALAAGSNELARDFFEKALAVDNTNRIAWLGLIDSVFEVESVDAVRDSLKKRVESILG